MKVVIQRVSAAHVSVENQIVGSIDKGLLVLVGIGTDDTAEDVEYIATKVVQMRIFNDENGKMNWDIKSVNGAILIISQFTLFADTKKGNRPSYTAAAVPNVAIPLYENFCNRVSQLLTKRVERGIFGADMKVSLVNDGPVTISIDSKNK